MANFVREMSAVSRTTEACTSALCGVGYSATKVPPRVAYAPNLGYGRKTCQKKICVMAVLLGQQKEGKLCGNLVSIFFKKEGSRGKPHNFPPDLATRIAFCNIWGRPKRCPDAVFPRNSLWCVATATGDRWAIQNSIHRTVPQFGHQSKPRFHKLYCSLTGGLSHGRRMCAIRSFTCFQMENLETSERSQSREDFRFRACTDGSQVKNKTIILNAGNDRRLVQPQLLFKFVRAELRRDHTDERCR